MKHLLFTLTVCVLLFANILGVSSNSTSSPNNSSSSSNNSTNPSDNSTSSSNDTTSASNFTSSTTTNTPLPFQINLKVQNAFTINVDSNLATILNTAVASRTADQAKAVETLDETFRRQIITALGNIGLNLATVYDFVYTATTNVVALADSASNSALRKRATSSNFNTGFSVKLNSATSSVDVTKVQADFKSALTSETIKPPSGVNIINLNPNLSVTVTSSPNNSSSSSNNSTSPSDNSTSSSSYTTSAIYFTSLANNSTSPLNSFTSSSSNSNSSSNNSTNPSDNSTSSSYDTTSASNFTSSTTTNTPLPFQINLKVQNAFTINVDSNLATILNTAVASRTADQAKAVETLDETFRRQILTALGNKGISVATVYDFVYTATTNVVALADSASNSALRKRATSSNFNTGFSVKLNSATSSVDVTKVQADFKSALTSETIKPPSGVIFVIGNSNLSVAATSSASTAAKTFGFIYTCLVLLIMRSI